MTREEELKQIARQRRQERAGGKPATEPTVPSSPDEPLQTGADATEAAKQRLLELRAEAEKRRDTGSVGGYAKDLGLSALSGLRKGEEFLAGAGGTTYNLLAGAHQLLEKWAGSDPERLKELQDYYEKNRWGVNVTPEEAAEATTPYLGKPYDPKTKLGKVVQTAGELTSGGGAKNVVRDIVAPAIGSGVGGEIGEAIGGEKGRAIGELAGGVTGSVGSEGIKRLLSPKIAPEKLKSVQTLGKEGVELTAGQATGSPKLKYLEVGPYANKPGAIADQQAKQFTRAALKRAGIDSDIASPEVMRVAQENFGQQYDDIIRRANGIHMDPQLQNELVDIGSSYERLRGNQMAPAVEQYFNRITKAAADNGGVVPPDVFQTIRSDMAKDIRRLKDSDAVTADTLRDFQDSLFASVGRNGQPEIAAEWKQLNNNYRNFKTVEKSLGGPGEDAALGYVSPARLRATVERQDKTDYTQGQGDFSDLVHAGASLAPLPNSGTAARLAPTAISGVIGGAGSQLLSGQPLAALGTLGAAGAASALPAIVSSTLTSKPVRTSLIKRASGEHPALFNPMQLAPLADQAADSLPVPVEVAPQAAPAVPPDQQGRLVPPADPMARQVQLAGLDLPQLLAKVLAGGRAVG